MSLFYSSPSNVTLNNPVKVVLELADEYVGTMILMPGTYSVDYLDDDDNHGYLKIVLSTDGGHLTATAQLKDVADAVYDYSQI
jgi:hypothetical protein